VRRPPGRLGSRPAHGLASVRAGSRRRGAQPSRGARAPQRRGAGGGAHGARVLPARRRRRGRARARGRGGRAACAARRGAGGGRRARSDHRGAACACESGPSRTALTHGVELRANALADSRPWFEKIFPCALCAMRRLVSRTWQAIARGRRQVCASRASTLAATAGAVQAVRQLLAGGDAAAAQQFADGAACRPRPAVLRGRA